MTNKKHAYFRFYGGLNDFLPPRDRQAEVRYSFWGRPAVKDAIEAQGVPHPEVDLIVSNGTPASFDATLRPGDRLSVYPWIQHLARPETALRPSFPTPRRFVCDVHLRRLARYLRMLGVDTWFDAEASDVRLARIASRENRILLTRDVGLLKRSQVRLGLFVRSQNPERQLTYVVGQCAITREMVSPFQRCVECNRLLERASPSEVRREVPPHARRTHETFRSCPECESVYWDGTHVDRMRRLIRRVFDTGS